MDNGFLEAPAVPSQISMYACSARYATSRLTPTVAFESSIWTHRWHADSQQTRPRVRANANKDVFACLQAAFHNSIENAKKTGIARWQLITMLSLSALLA